MQPTLFGFLEGKFSRREVFDHIMTKMEEQGVPSIKNNRCSYRGDNNTCCGIGHLITDTELKGLCKKFEYCNINVVQIAFICEAIQCEALKNNYPVSDEYRFNRQFLNSIQNAHDGAYAANKRANIYNFDIFMINFRKNMKDIELTYL